MTLGWPLASHEEDHNSCRLLLPADAIISNVLNSQPYLMDPLTIFCLVIHWPNIRLITYTQIQPFFSSNCFLTWPSTFWNLNLHNRRANYQQDWKIYWQHINRTNIFWCSSPYKSGLIIKKDQFWFFSASFKTQKACFTQNKGSKFHQNFRHYIWVTLNHYGQSILGEMRGMSFQTCHHQLYIFGLTSERNIIEQLGQIAGSLIISINY
jgi:hypothetical protein